MSDMGIRVISTQTCGNCKFAKGVPGGPPGFIRCRRFPEDMFAFLAGRGNQGEPIIQAKPVMRVFPAVDEACGEWRPRIEIRR